MLEQLELLINAITTVEKGIGVINKEGKFVWVNESLEEIYECPPVELIGQYFTNGFSEEDVLKAWQSHWDLFNNKRPSFPTFSVTYYAGSITKQFSLSGQATILKDKERYCLLFMQEIQPLHEHTIIRERQNSLFYAMLESQTNYLIGIDLRGNYSFVNRAYQQKFGQKRSYKGDPYRTQLHPADISAFEKTFEECLKRPEKLIALKLRLSDEDGTYYMISWEFVAITNEQAQAIEVQGVGYDISSYQEIAPYSVPPPPISQLHNILLNTIDRLAQTETNSVEDFLQNALSEVATFTGTKWGLVYKIKEKGMVAQLVYTHAAAANFPTLKTIHRIRLESLDWWRQKVHCHAPIEIQDIQTLPENATHEKQLLDRLHIKSLIAIPMIHQKVLSGYIVFAHDAPLNYHPSEITVPLTQLGTVFSQVFQETELSKALIENKRKYELLAVNMTDMVSKHDLNGVYKYVSPSCKILVGYEDWELIGTSAFDYVHPDDHAGMAKNLEQVLSGKVTQAHYRKRRKDGTYCWMEITARLSGEGCQQEIVASIRTIHQRKITEDTNAELLQKSQHLNKKLQTSQDELKLTLDRTRELNELLVKSEKKFRSLTEKSFDAIVVYNEEGLITYATPSVYNVVGYTPEELVGTFRHSYIFSEDLPLAKEFLSNVLQRPQERIEGFFRLVRKDGETIWTETIMTNLLLDESIQGVVCNFRDVTEQRQGEQALAEYSERLAIATQSANIGIWDWHISKDYLVWDERTLDMFGLTFGRFAHNKQSWLQIIHPDDRARVQSEIDLALQQTQDFNTEYRIILPQSQEERCIKSYAKVTRIYNEPTRMTGVNLDITNIKQVEQQLRENNEELRKTNAELDQFVYSTSHNLRAPLASVLGLISVLEGTTDSEERTQYLQLIESSIHRLDETIHEIIDYSRNARIEIKREPVKFREIIADILDGLYFLRSSIDIDVRLDIAEDIGFVSDPNRLRTIFNNLLSNAIKYFNPHVAQPFVAITITPKNRGVEIVVQDNGVGINKAAQDKIFDMFYRASHHASGSGLGLYIVKESVQKLDGTISLVSEPGQGATFRLHLPSFN
uniref:histidine kinase n=1 Tax=Roseihalotalea indica TaxID=2867963 RepID=A0AA49JJ42_9BACT|nr:PAS domain S-box protein [Tunicatimonas sp. TK19036]